VAVGNHPLGLTFDGENIWAANSVDGTVSKIRARYGNIVGTFDVGTYPQYATFDGANIWVTNYEGTVTKLRASDGALLGTFPVGSSAEKGIAFDGTNIWVANVNANTVSKLRASDGSLLGAFPTDYHPYAILSSGTRIWVACEGSVTELRAGDGSQVGIYAIEHEPELRAIVSDGHNIWVGQYATAGNPEQGITAINPRKGAVLGSVKVPKGPSGLAFDGTYIWVSEANAGTVSIVDPVTKVDLQDIGVGDYPDGIVFDGESIWVANQKSNTVSRITPE
jgi:YVTN family beta-propeller protein